MGGSPRVLMQRSGPHGSFTMLVVSRDDVIQFARRDWAALSMATEQDWLRRKRGLTPAEILRLSDDMRRHTRALKPNGPLEADRSADLATHRRVGQALRAVAHPTR